MAFIKPNFAIDVYKPNRFGMVEKFGLSRDWRFTGQSKGFFRQPGWNLRNLEFIEPLAALAPQGEIGPRDCGALGGATWELNGNHAAQDNWRTVYPDWKQPVRSYQFADGEVHAAAAPWTDWLGTLRSTAETNGIKPNLAVHLVRNAPPSDQGIQAACFVRLPAICNRSGDYEAAIVTLCLPWTPEQDDEFAWSGPALHYIAVDDIPESGFINVMVDGYFIAEGPKGTTRGQSDREKESWVVEYVEDTTLFDGGYILIREMGNPDAWWVYYDRYLRLSSWAEWQDLGLNSETVTEGEARWGFTCQGAIHTVNLSPVIYGYSRLNAAAWPNGGQPWPGDEWQYDEAGTPWGRLVTPADGWTVAASLKDSIAAFGGVYHRPQVTVARDAYGAADDVHGRPVVWYVTETHPAIQGSPAATRRWTTEGYGSTRNFSWTWGEDYKQCRGVIEWWPVDPSLPDWFLDNHCIDVFAGWQTGAGGDFERQHIATAWGLPEGTQQARVGEARSAGNEQPRLEFGGFDAAKLADVKAAIMDLRQAGGRTVAAWAGHMANRLGINPARVYVATLDNDGQPLAARLIPTNPVPSAPFLAPADGDTWLNHIAQVENAARIRVCWPASPTYDLWIDGGAPPYVPGTSATWDLDYDTAIAEDIVFELVSNPSIKGLRNVLKAMWSEHEQRMVSYYADSLPDRTALIGDDWPAVLVEEDADGDTLWYRFNRDHRTLGAGLGGKIRWTMQMRPDALLWPDGFVRVVDLPGTGVPPGDPVFRILSHTINIDMAEFVATSTIEAQLVYLDAGAMGANAQVLNGGLL